MNTVLVEPFGYSKTLTTVLEVCKRARAENPYSDIVMLGNVLNGDPIKDEIKKLGIKNIIIPPIGFGDFLNNVKKDTIIITSPYGTKSELIKIIQKRKLIHYDCTSPTIIEKRDFILQNKNKTIIYVANVNTVEADYLANETRHCFLFYDLSSTTSVYNRKIFKKKYNKESTIVIFQSDASEDVLIRALRKIHAFLPKAVINKNISDENYAKKKVIAENIKEGDLLLNVSCYKKPTNYLLNYYHLSNKNVYFATVGSVTEAMLLNVNDDKNIVIVSDGSVSKNIILEIYNYFYYKSIKVNLRDSKIEFQSLN